MLSTTSAIPGRPKGSGSTTPKLLKHALALDPDNGYIQDSWGWHLFIRGRLGEAVVELEKAARLNPNESTILEQLVDAYLRNNLEGEGDRSSTEMDGEVSRRTRTDAKKSPRRSEACVRS